MSMIKMISYITTYLVKQTKEVDIANLFIALNTSVHVRGKQRQACIVPERVTIDHSIRGWLASRSQFV